MATAASGNQEDILSSSFFQSAVDPMVPKYSISHCQLCAQAGPNYTAKTLENHLIGEAPGAPPVGFAPHGPR